MVRGFRPSNTISMCLNQWRLTHSHGKIPLLSAHRFFRAGKGTQGVVLGRISRFFHCACGDVFRALDLGSPMGRRFLEFSSKGLLVPDELTIELWQTTIDAQVEAHIFKPGTDSHVLDGIPRNLKPGETYGRAD